MPLIFGNPDALRLIETGTFQMEVTELQTSPEFLKHGGNKPIKMMYFLFPPPPNAMLMSGIQVIFR